MEQNILGCVKIYTFNSQRGNNMPPPPFNQHYGTCVIMILNKCVSQVNDVAYGPPVNIYTIFFATE